MRFQISFFFFFFNKKKDSCFHKKICSFQKEKNVHWLASDETFISLSRHHHKDHFLSLHLKFKLLIKKEKKIIFFNSLFFSSR